MLRKTREQLHQETHILLPNSFESMLATWPELTPLLESFANRDPGTFMHSIAVHTTANRLAQDLFLLTKPSYTLQNEFFKRSPFLFVHDIGKTAAHTNLETAQKFVHPLDQMNRPAYDKARHWLHPQIGADLLILWAKNASPSLQPFIKKWAQLTCLHDRQLNPFLNRQNENLQYADKLSLFIFSIADTSMAMGLPRPNKNSTNNVNEIRQVLHRKFLQDNTLSELFPGQNPSQLREYILVSILGSLQELEKKYPRSVWIAPSGFSNPSFALSISADSKKTNLLDNLAQQAWKNHEPAWDGVMREMDRLGIF